MLINISYGTGICFHSPPERIIIFFMIPAFVFIAAPLRRNPFTGNAMIELSVVVYPELVEVSQSIHRQTFVQLWFSFRR